jgi:bacterioferritin
MSSRTESSKVKQLHLTDPERLVLNQSAIEAGHADRLARRIVQLGGNPDFSPDSLSRRSHSGYDDSADLNSTLKANLIAERVAIESYSQIIALIGDKDSTTRRLLEDILADEQGHADELKDWLAD